MGVANVVHGLETAVAPQSSHDLECASGRGGSPLSESTSDFRIKARCFRPALAALAALALLLSFISLYPLGGYGGSVPIRTIRDGQANIILLVAPVGFVLVVGTVIAFLPVRAGKRFLVSLACFLGLHSTVLVRHSLLAPLYVWCRGVMPNPVSIGIMLASAGAATLVGSAIHCALGRGTSPRRIATVLMLSAVIVASLSVYLAAPYFALQWRPAPAVFSKYYALEAEMTMPPYGAHPATGFWFRSRQIAKYVESTKGPLWGRSLISAGEDALFLTRGFVARLRLSGASIAWSLPHDFGGLEQDGVPYADAFAVWWQDDMLYVVNRSAGWDIFAMDWLTGRLLWEIRKPEVRRYAPLNPGATIVVTPQMIITVPEDGKAVYEVIDPKTGATTRYPLPGPEGTVLAEAPTLGDWGALGPYLIEGTDGTVAILAFFAPPGVAVTQRLQDDGPPPDVSCLFGLDPETGEIAWQIHDVGDWRSPPGRFGGNLMVTRDVVVRWDTEPLWKLTAWEPSTGRLLWDRAFSPGAEFLVSPGGAVVVEDGGTRVACLDLPTGGVRWQTEDVSLCDLSQLFLCKGIVVTASPSVVRGRLLSDGTEVSRLDASPGTRLAAWGILAETVVEVRSFTGPAENVNRIFIDVRNGRTYSVDDVLGFLCVQDGCTAEGFLFAAAAGSFPKPSWTLNGIVPVFKSEGVFGPIPGIGEPRATHGSLGEVALEGWVLLMAFDARVNSYRVFVLMPTIASPFRGESPWLEPP